MYTLVHVLGGIRHISGRQAGFWLLLVFMVKIDASEPLKSVTERMFILSNFTEATKKFTMNYHHSKLFKNFEKTSEHIQKVLIQFYLQKNIHLVIQSL
jgi:hypothetical protein